MPLRTSSAVTLQPVVVCCMVTVLCGYDVAGRCKPTPDGGTFGAWGGKAFRVSMPLRYSSGQNKTSKNKKMSMDLDIGLRASFTRDMDRLAHALKHVAKRKPARKGFMGITYLTHKAISRNLGA